MREMRDATASSTGGTGTAPGTGGALARRTRRPGGGAPTGRAGNPLRAFPIVVAVAAVAGAATACGGDGAGAPGADVPLRDSAGITLVENGDRPGAWAEGEGWTVRVDLEIGGDESSEEGFFGRVSDVAVDSEGRIYVLDGFAQAVKVYGPDGGHLRTLGGPGQGPGQIGQFLENIVVQEGDTLLVPDWGQNRLTRFLPDGTVLSTEPFPAGDAYRSWWAQGPQHLWYRQLDRTVDDEGMWGNRDFLVRVEPDGLDTLFTFDYEVTSLGGPEVGLKVPLVLNGPTWTILPDGGFAWTSLDRTRVRIHGPDGELRRLVSRADWELEPVTPEDVDALKDLLALKLGPYGMDRTSVDQMDVPDPEWWPALAAIESLPDGTLLVQRGDIEPEEVEPWAMNTVLPGALGGPTFDVLDPGGRYLGSVRFPERFRIMEVTDDAIYGLRRDEMDVHHVVRLRIEGR